MCFRQVRYRSRLISSNCDSVAQNGLRNLPADDNFPLTMPFVPALVLLEVLENRCRHSCEVVQRNLNTQTSAQTLETDAVLSSLFIRELVSYRTSIIVEDEYYTPPILSLIFHARTFQHHHVMFHHHTHLHDSTSQPPSAGPA